MNIEQLQQRVSKMDQQHQQMILFTLKRYQQQQNAVFIDYDLNILEAEILNYKQFNIHKRTAFAKNIKSIKDVLSPQSFQSFLFTMVHDFSQIQGYLLTFIHQQVNRKNIQPRAIQQYISITKILIQNGELQIKLRACNLLPILMQNITQKQRQSIFLFVEGLSKYEKEDVNTAWINLLKLIVPYRKSNQIQQQFKKLQDIYNGANQGMKKQIINYCSLIAKYVSSSFLDEEIIGRFIDERIKQKSLNIRKNCLEILPSLVENSTAMKHHLAAVLLLLTNDNNKIVKLTAFKVVPEFIAKYKDSDISDKLIDLYAFSTDHEINKQANTQDQIIQKVVFYFPGVLATIGVSKWSKISSLFSKFLFYKNIEIKLSICSSLHEICKLLGPQLAEDYIIKALNYLVFNQNCYELKLKALEKISQIIKVFRTEIRLNCIDIFMVIQQDSIIWRYKYVIAEQIQAFSKLYNSQDLYVYIFPIIFKLCSDNIGEVRQKAADNIHHLLFAIRKGKNLIKNALQFIKTLAKSKEYQQRMVFCRTIRHLYKMPQFVDQMKDFVWKLAQDKIISVRISLAIVFQAIFQEDDKKSLIVFSEVLERLEKEQQTSQYFEQELSH